MKIIEATGINKDYDGRWILRNFNLSVEPGEIVTITGKSGSGKSTLLNIIGLLEDRSSGELIINGERVPSARNREATLLRRHIIGYIFQNYALLEYTTVEKNLLMALKYANTGDKNKAIREALEIVGLSGYEKKQVYTLSGGEQQRVAIARVFLKPCQLILADEPTGSLDEANEKMILTLFLELRKVGKTILMVTHNTHIAKCFDRNIHLEM